MRVAGLTAIALGLVLGLGAPAPVLGSEYEGNRAQLIGWSKDGRSWAVLSSSPEERIEVYTAGKLVLTLCTAESPDSDCDDSPTQKAIDTVDTDKFSGMQRVDVEKQQFLRPFHLRPMRPGLRRAFQKRFRLDRTGKRKAPGGKRCPAGWRLVQKASAEVLHEHREKTGCARAKGGYLHASGAFALVKQSHFGETYDEDVGYSTYEWESYVLVALPKS